MLGQFVDLTPNVVTLGSDVAEPDVEAFGAVELVHQIRLVAACHQVFDRLRILAKLTNVDHGDFRLAVGLGALRVRTVKGMSNDLALEVHDLVVEYGSVRAVDGVTFSARRGAVTAIIGPNGAGKTSSIEACEGYRRTFRGSIRVLGLDPVRDHGSLTKRMGVMLQGGGVYPSARVGESVRHYCALYDDVVSHEALIERTGLSGLEKRTWRALSGGEKQRLSLALSLTGKPEIVFLDEPTAGVDIDGRAAIRRLVRELANDGCSVIMATHELDEAERCADDVVVFDRGSVIHQSSLAELLGSEQAIRFTASSLIDEAALNTQLGIDVRRSDDGYTLLGSSDAALISRIDEWLKANGVSLRSVVAGGRRLEEAVQELRKGENR